MTTSLHLVAAMLLALVTALLVVVASRPGDLHPLQGSLAAGDLPEEVGVEHGRDATGHR